MVDRELSGRLSSAPQRRRTLELVWCAILTIIAVAVFGDGLSRYLHGDDWVILQRVRPDGWRTVVRWFAFEEGNAWGFRPALLVTASLTRLFGEGRPQHVASLLLHVTASILAFTVVRGGVAADPAARRRTDRIWPAAVASLVFLLHPANDEAVYWFAAIVYPLAATLGLAYWLLSESAVPAARAASWLALVLALLAHPVAAVFPLARLLVPPRRGVSRLGPAAATLLAFSYLLVAGRSPDGSHLGSETLVSLGRLAAQAVWPFGPPVLSLVLLAALVTLAALGLVRGDRVGPAGLTLLLGGAALSAVAFRGGDDAPHHLYLPALGLAMVLGALWSGPVPGKLASLGLAVFLVARGSGLNARRASAWNAAGALGDRAVETLLTALPQAGPVLLAGAPERLDGARVLDRGLAERVGTARPDLAITDLQQPPSAGALRPPLPRGTPSAPASPRRFGSLLDAGALEGKRALLFDGDGWLDVSIARRGPCLDVQRPGRGEDGSIGEERVPVRVRMEAGPKRLVLLARGPGDPGEPAILEVRFGGRHAGTFRTTDRTAVYQTTVVATGGEDALELRAANGRRVWVELAVLECR